MKAKLNLRSFVQKEFLTEGEWELSYHDRTHIKDKCYVPFAKVEFERSISHDNGDADRTSSPFVVTAHGSEMIEGNLKDSFPGEADDRMLGKTRFRVMDQLGESLQRTGLLPLGISPGDWDSLGKAAYLVMVLDTGALRRRVASTLLSYWEDRTPQKPIWVLIPLIATLEVANHRAEVNSADRDRPRQWKKADTILRRRPSSTVVPLEIEQLRQKCPVEYLELYPDLPSFYKSEDKERNDRLILEGLKSWMRQRGIRENVYLITADLGFAQMAQLEGIPCVFCRLESLAGRVRSVRYDFFRGDFVAHSLHEVLWDLAHVFGCVKATRTDGEEKPSVVLSYYFPNKTLDEVFAGMLEVTYQDAD